MEKIAIITDSSCDLSEKDRIDNNIFMCPLRLIYKDREYLDKIEITSEEMYARIRDEIPMTSLPNLEYCKNMLNELISQGYTHAVVITISIALSGTHNCLKILFGEFENSMKFSFFDTKTLGFPVGAISLEAAKMIRSDRSFEEIVNMLPDIRRRTKSYIAVDSLEYLIKGGRISKVKGAVGQMLNLKPILSSNDDGVLYDVAKIRGKKKSIERIRSIINEFLDKYKCRLWVLHGDALKDGMEMLESVRGHCNITEITLETIGAAMGAHTGPGVVGFTVIYED